MHDQVLVDVLISSHTCGAVLKRLDCAGALCVIINNGAAGLPNLSHDLAGLIARIGAIPSPHRAQNGTQIGRVRVDAPAVPYDQERWTGQFLANWPGGSDTHVSYFSTIQGRL